MTAICVTKYCSQPLNTNTLHYGRTITDFERKYVGILYTYTSIFMGAIFTVGLDGEVG
jgi:hypothetical protein